MTQDLVETTLGSKNVEYWNLEYVCQGRKKLKHFKGRLIVITKYNYITLNA